MSVQGVLTVNGQMSLIDPQPRTMDVYYSMPDEPNEKTGLLVLVPGFGANCNSKVYQKMRRVFADQYNLYVIQCEYFGSKFMQDPEKPNLADFVESIPEQIRHKLLEDFKGNYHLLDGYTLERMADIDETKSDYAEMGPLQASDILISIKSFSDYIESKRLPLNKKNIIGYGHSHGAYLLYLCNALMPNCFTDIIDISAWLYPEHMDDSRVFFWTTTSQPHITFHIIYKYIASELNIDREAYNLPDYYQSFINHTNIYSFHGDNDDLIKLEDKINFLSGISNSSIEVIGENRVDNEIFFSNDHGLGADFLKLFDYVVRRYAILSDKKDREGFSFENMSFSTSRNTYWLGYDERIDNIQMYIVEK